MVLSCQGCNNHKYNKITGIDTVTQEGVELFHPRNQTWTEHFYWSDDVLEILGKNAIGRVTVEELKLNRQELKNLRKLLATVGKHPPKE